MSSYVVLGSGPAGLLAAHAIQLQTGHEPAIISRKERSPLYGAQYLHKPIPGTSSFNTVGRNVHYTLRGSTADYRAKVYGDRLPEGESVSPEDLLGDHQAWDIRAVYEELWLKYEPVIIDYTITSLREMARLIDALGAMFLVSTVPRSLLCDNAAHTFQAERVHARGDAPDLNRWAGVTVPDETVICDGTEAERWYRAARVFGHTTVEWPITEPRPARASTIDKPIDHDCDCNPLGVSVFAGRYGKWEKGVLSHDAYFDTLQALS